MLRRVGPDGGAAKKLVIAFHFTSTGGWDSELNDCRRCQRMGTEGRNCRAHFPQQRWNPDYRWFPQYREGRLSYGVPDVWANECPVGIITSESKQMLALEARNFRTKEAAGACLYGPDSRRWPAWWLDVVTLIEQERTRRNNARVKAEIEEVERRR